MTGGDVMDKSVKKAIFPAERESTLQQVNLIASILASAPRTDHFLAGRADVATKIHVGEGQLLSLHVGVLNALNFIGMAWAGIDKPKLSKGCLGYADRALSWINQDTIGMRRERLIRALRLEPSSCSSQKKSEE